MLPHWLQSLILLTAVTATAANAQPLVKRNGEGVHLVNCFVKNGGQVSSMFYYLDDSKADGQTRPDASAGTSNNGYTVWEGHPVSGRFPASGVTFTSNIQANGSGLPPGTRAGTGYNGSNWVCFRDNNRYVYSDGGESCKSIYYCLKG